MRNVSKAFSQFRIKGDVIIFLNGGTFEQQQFAASFFPVNLVAEVSSTLRSVSDALPSSVSVICRLPSHWDISMSHEHKCTFQ